MINLNEINSHATSNKLKEYNGKNPYIKKLKNKLLKDGKIKLTDTQIKYVKENFDFEPILINKVVNITEYLGESIKESEKLNFTPQRILIEYVLADNEKTYHVYGKLTKKQEKSGMYFLPKTQVVDDPYFDNIDVEVDFDKYDEILAKEGKKLFEHQKSGVKFLLGRKGAILADDMGLGKSSQSIIASLESGAKRILLVCPSSVKLNWEREINRFCDKTTVISGSRWDISKFTIINFDILKNFHTIKGKDDDLILNNELANSNFDLCIIDEAHFLKNTDSNRAKIMYDLCVNIGIDRVWLLTGTPVANRPMDFYNLLKLIKAPLVNNWKYYVTRYCDGKQIKTKLKNGKFKKIWLTDGASNLDELNSKSKNLVLRRLKDEVLDMPDKTITPIYYELNNKQRLEYENLWENYLIKRREEKKSTKISRELVELGLLRKFIAMQAIPETIEMVDNIISQGHKVIIFTCFTEELMELYNHYGNKAVIHYGGMSINDKQKSVDEFQKDGGPMVFIGNVISAGVGITLTKSTYVVFNSYDWVPGVNEQCEDRSYRLGQKNNVTVYYTLFKDTISMLMWGTLKKKQKNINKIIGNNDAETVENIIDLAINSEEDGE